MLGFLLLAGIVVLVRVVANLRSCIEFKKGLVKIILMELFFQLRISGDNSKRNVTFPQNQTYYRTGAGIRHYIFKSLMETKEKP